MNDGNGETSTPVETTKTEETVKTEETTERDANRSGEDLND